jgi:putative ABC transport system permease protein
VDGKNCPIWFWATDSKYIQMMGFSIVQGRNFLKNSEAETGNMIINETAAKRYGWDIGKQVGNGRIVGIMKDFNLISLRDEVEPFAFWYSDAKNGYALSTISIKLKQGEISAAVNTIGKIYNEYSTEIPFRYFFLDDHLNLLYSKENQQVKLIVSFSLLSVIISILGILGLSVFLCQNKIKEIGIRKVNGAQDMEVIAMLNKDFIKWVAIAFLIAIPLSWYAMHKWLQNFAFKTELSWWIFAAAGAIALFIALLTVSWQSWRAATRNPVESLRYE